MLAEGMNGVFAAKTLRTLREWAITQKRENVVSEWQKRQNHSARSHELQLETSDLIRTFGRTTLI